MQKPKTVLHILFLVIVLLLGTSSPLFSSLAVDAAGTPDHIRLTWAAEPAVTQTITWRTGAATVNGQVQYAEAARFGQFPQKSITVSAEVEGLTTNLGDVATHSVTLTGLKPDTRYVYRVGGPEEWSPPYYFTTAPGTVRPFKFLIFGDSQSVNYGVWRTTAYNAYQTNPDAAFFTNVGDLVDVGQDYAQWQSWFNGAQGMIETIPAMPVTGNHECYTPSRSMSRPVLFTSQFKLPLNGPDGLKGQVYSFDYANVHFVMLDSQQSEQGRFMPNMLEDQKVWLEKDLQATQKKWKVVFLHRPLYNNKPGEGDGNIRRTFAGIFDKYHVDVVFTGHDHAYSRTYPLFGGLKADSPAQGTVYVATGRSGTKTYPNIIAKEWHEFFYNPAVEPNYLAVEVNGSSLKVKAFKQSGDLVDAWEIHKQ
ncbi:purple acid phosphatase family protein [Sporomusa aerivorans]|uniref:purple acid phosphatase family protein n=1 Tax=Sporomusa aerivorans TaxID=204936 RepID=UPI00352AE0D1